MLDEVLRHNGIERNDLYAMISFLSRTRSRLLAISLEDLFGVVAQPNIPGTIDEHPNWRQKLPVALEDMIRAFDAAALKATTSGRVRAAG
jgi:4-alpha-glucanotransferase